MVPWNAPRAKVQIKLTIQRLRTLQEKKLALAKKSRRDIADLVQKGRIETAKLRVEGLIQDDIYVELLELLELYAEKLQARFGMLEATVGEGPDPSIEDAVCAIVYAAPRTELKELHVLREILMHKFGRNFSLSLLPTEKNPPGVPARVLSKLAVFAPPVELVDAYLSEIASGYGVSYIPLLEGAPGGAVTGGNDLVGGASGEDAGAVGGGTGGAASPGTGSGSGSGGGGDAMLAVPSAAAAREASPASSAGSGGKQDAAFPAEKAEKAASPALSPAQQAAPPKYTPQPTVVRKPTEDDDLAARFERLKNLR